MSYAPDDKDEADHAAHFIDAVSAMLVEKPQPETKHADSAQDTAAATADPPANDAAKDSTAPGA